MSIQHGFSVQRSGDDALDRLQQRVKDALDRIAQQATASQLTDKGRYVLVGNQELQNQARGPNISAAASIAPKFAYQAVDNATAIDFIAIDGWFDGARVELLVTNGGGLVFHNNTGSPPAGAYPLRNATNANVTIAQGATIAYRRNDANKLWSQVD